MEKEILDIIYDYSINSKVIDIPAIIKISNIIKKNDFNDYIKKYRFEDDLSSVINNCLALYDATHKIMYYDINEINKTVANEWSNNVLSFSELEAFMNININLLQIILHEIMHVKQHKLLKESKEDTVETILLKANLYNYELVDLYSYIPSERLAQIDSFKMLINIISTIRNDIPRIYNKYEKELLSCILFGYQNEVSPVEYYLINTNQIDIWKSFSFYNSDYYKMLKKVRKKLSLNERLRYGLPVTESELLETAIKM